MQEIYTPPVSPLDNPEYYAELYEKYEFIRRVVSIKPKDITKNWRSWKSEIKEYANAIAESEKEFQIQEEVFKALKGKNIYGMSFLFLSVHNDDLEKPLDMNSISKGDLKGIYALDLLNLTPLGERQFDLYREDNYFYNLFVIRKEIQCGDLLLKEGDRIHPSRLIIFCKDCTLHEPFSRIASESTISTAELYENFLCTSKFSSILDGISKYVEKMVAEDAWLLEGIARERFFAKDSNELVTIDYENHPLRWYYESITSAQEELLKELFRIDEVLMRNAFGEIKEELQCSFPAIWKFSRNKEADERCIQAFNAAVEIGIITKEIARKELIKLGILNKESIYE